MSCWYMACSCSCCCQMLPRRSGSFGGALGVGKLVALCRQKYVKICAQQIYCFPVCHKRQQLIKIAHQLQIKTRVCCRFTCSCSGKLCSVPSIIGIRLPKASRWVWSGVEDSSEIVVGEILYNARAFYSASRVFGDPNQLPCRRDRLHQNTSKIRRNTWLSPQTRGNSRSAATLFQTCVQSKCI